MKELQEKLHVSATDFGAQVCHLRSVFRWLKYMDDKYDQAADEVAAAMSFVTHPELTRQGILNFREYVKENEKKVVEQKAMTKGDSIFQRIIEPYKGNVLHVDFWQMSCGACRAGMLEMRGEVEEKRQLRARRGLDQRQHVAPQRGGDEKIAVLHTGADALKGDQLPDRVILQPDFQFLLADRSKNRHRAAYQLCRFHIGTESIGVLP